MNQQELREHVGTVVIVMMENRSFDHVLGHLSAPQYGNRRDVEGMSNPDRPDYLNPNGDGQMVAPFWMEDEVIGTDLPHSLEDVRTQLAKSEVSGTYTMTGFVKAYEHELHANSPKPAVMGLLKPSGAPVTTALAHQYTVCDNWFAAVPTSTAPNRLMAMCGYTEIADTGVLIPNQDTVYDWLLDHGVRFRVYSGGLPFFALMPRLAPLMLTGHFRRLHELQEDLRNEPPDQRPQVIFIEPEYYDSPIHFTPPCDNHAPLAMAPGEHFLAKIYAWLTADAEAWSKTVLLVSYDEHGGFYDHVPPLKISYRNAKGVSFDSTGPRVPALIAGPYAPRGGVCKTKLDNTALLQFLADRFGAPNTVYSPQVGVRLNQGIGSIADALVPDAGNTTVLDFSNVPEPAPHTGPGVNNNLRQGFAQAAADLVSRHGTEALSKYPELKGMVKAV